MHFVHEHYEQLTQERQRAARQLAEDRRFVNDILTTVRAVAGVKPGLLRAANQERRRARMAAKRPGLVRLRPDSLRKYARDLFDWCNRDRDWDSMWCGEQDAMGDSIEWHRREAYELLAIADWMEEGMKPCVSMSEAIEYLKEQEVE